MPDSAFMGISRSLYGRRWMMRGADERMALALSQRLGVPEMVGRILSARGVGLEQAEGFLSPRLKEQMPDPFVLADMEKAAKRVADAVQANERIAIFGDYDVDGATSSALLRRVLRGMGVEPMVYIPDRIAEGYGPSIGAMDKLAAQGVKLVITVDCGAVSFEPLAHAKNRGMEVVVVDHHMGETRLPEAVAVVNPNRADAPMEDGAPVLGYLAAVGVSFMLAVALVRELRGRGFFASRPAPDLMQLLDLVALGTVCDVVPLKGLNRALVSQGLKVLAQRQNVGLRALSDVGRIQEVPTAYHLGFVLGPRINAGGRVGKSSLGADILSCEDAADAMAMAQELDGFNRERMTIEAMVQEAALDQIEKRQSQMPVIFAHVEGWHPGVIGIVAGRIKERYYRPTAVIAFENGIGKASARSVSGIDFGAAIHAAKAMGLVEAGGGHAMAGGFTVKAEKLDDLHAFFCERMGAAVDALGDAPPLYVDAAIGASGVQESIVQMLAKAAPFGTSNPEPTIVIPHARVMVADTLKNGEHARLIVTDHQTNHKARLKAMAFRIKDTELERILPTLPGKVVHLAGKLRLNHWQGTTSAEMLIDDLALVG